MKRRVLATARAAGFTTIAAIGISLFVAAGCSRTDPTTETGVPTIETDKVPSDARSRDIEFDGKIRVLGFRTKGGPSRPGKRVTQTIYWQAKEKIEPGYKMVAALVDDAGERLLQLDDASPLRELHDGKPAHPPETWEPGKIYADELTFTIPEGVKTWRVKLVAGLVKGDEKSKFTGTDNVDGLALVATSGTGIKRAKIDEEPSVPHLRADRIDAKTKIKIDGKLDEDAWKEAPVLKLVDPTSGKPNRKAPVQGKTRVLWSQQGLYVAFEVTDSNILGGFKPTDKDAHLWTKDTVEIMVDPDGNGDNNDYYEIQISPQNLVFDSQFDKYNEPKKEPDGPFGNQEWSSGVKSAVSVEGTIDKADDKDAGYTVEAMIPWKSFSKAKKTPPALGDTWRVNFYVIKENNGVAWSPILGKGNFHFAPRFGEILWAEKDWAPPAANSAAPVASAQTAPPGVTTNVQAAVPAPGSAQSPAPAAKPVAAPKPAAPASAASGK